MKEIINDLIKLGQDVSKLTEENLNKLASKIMKHKPMTKEQAKKIVVEGIRKAATAQRKLANELEKHARIAISKAESHCHAKKPAKKGKKK